MKNKYQRLSKEEKKIARKDYASSSELNKLQSRRLKRAQVTGILGMIYGIGMIVYSLIDKGYWWEYITYCFMLIFGLGLYFKSKDFYIQLINKYLIERDNSKKDNKKK